MTIKALGTVGILLLLSGLGVVMSQEVRSSADVPSSESIMLSYGFPVLSGVTHLCQERVYAYATMRIAISHGMLSSPLWNPVKSLISFAGNWVMPGSILREPAV